MSKLIETGQDARQILKQGLDVLANAVKVTLGPRGRNVVIASAYGGYPTITKDGVTVAKEIELEDPLQDLGAQIIREVAAKTSDNAGDGTTTATVLAQAIYTEGLKLVTSGANPMDLKRGIDKAIEIVVEKLKKLSEPISDQAQIKQIAAISANNDQFIGNLIGDAMDKVGNDGVITVEEAKGMETSIEIVEGMQFERGYLSPFFVKNKETLEIELNNAYILIYDKTISVIKDLLPLLENVVGSNQPLLIIAENVEGNALPTLIVNNINGTINVCAVKMPGFGDRSKEMLEDIAILTSGTVVSTGLGHKLEDVTLNNLGIADKIVITKDTTTIVGGKGNPADIQKRIKELKAQLEKCDSDFDKEKLQERLGKLSGGVAVLKIGASTEIEMKEKKARIEDALHATRAAIEEGIIPGGGTGLLLASLALNDFTDITSLNEDIMSGMKIVKKAIQEPIKQIASNAGLEGSVVLNAIIKEPQGVGFNALTETYGNMKEMGIIDPTKVARVALQNAGSIASLLLMTEAIITNKPEPTKQPQHPNPMGMY